MKAKDKVDERAKKVYAAPRLTVHGTFAEVTLASTQGSVMDDKSKTRKRA